MSNRVSEVLARIEGSAAPATSETFTCLLRELSPATIAPVASLLETEGAAYLAEADRFCARMMARFPQPERYQLSLERFAEMVFAYLRWAAAYQLEGEYAAILDPDLLKRRGDVEDFYLEGLLWSYLFWANHYRIRSHFREWILEPRRGGNYLEVGIGHGLFFADCLEQGNFSEAIGCDISPKAIAYTRETLARLGLDECAHRLVEADFLAAEWNQKFGTCVLVEVLEHVYEPILFLEKAASLLTHDGKLFLTTVVNVPFIDHVTHFRTPDEVRALLKRAGLRIEKERVEQTFGTPNAQKAFDYIALCGAKPR